MIKVGGQKVTFYVKGTFAVIIHLLGVQCVMVFENGRNKPKPS